jgi:hypothetical protein
LEHWWNVTDKEKPKCLEQFDSPCSPQIPLAQDGTHASVVIGWQLTMWHNFGNLYFNYLMSIGCYSDLNG